MLVPTQHLNNVRLPVGEHHTLSIAQYSADTFCEVALFDERTGEAVCLPRLYNSVSAITTKYFHYVTHLELVEITLAAQEYVKVPIQDRVVGKYTSSQGK